MPDAAQVTQHIADIKERFDHWYNDEAAFAEASQLWGGGHGEHGTFKAPLETVAEHRRTRAAVRIARSGNGLYCYGLHFESPEMGFGFFPSIWQEAVFASREGATRAALAELLERLGEERSCGKTTDAEIEHVVRQLRARLQPRQQDLFAVDLTDDEIESTPMPSRRKS